MTGYGDKDTETRAREAGFDYFLAKPADPFVIERLIRCRHERPPGSADGV